MTCQIMRKRWPVCECVCVCVCVLVNCLRQVLHLHKHLPKQKNFPRRPPEQTRTLHNQTGLLLAFLYGTPKVWFVTCGFSAVCVYVWSRKTPPNQQAVERLAKERQSQNIMPPSNWIAVDIYLSVACVACFVRGKPQSMILTTEM